MQASMETRRSHQRIRQSN